MADTVRIGDLNMCCRLCLSEKVDALRSVFDGGIVDAPPPLHQRIATLVAVDITSDDKFSQMLCKSCIQRINDWHLFKQECHENQLKLEQWYQQGSTDISEMNILIKEEPIDDEEEEEDEDENDVIITPEVSMVVSDSIIKSESFSDAPPPLSPEPNDHNGMIDSSLVHAAPDPKQCRFCKREFSSVVGRKMHETKIHGSLTNSFSGSELGSGSYSQDDHSQSSIDSQQLTMAENDNEKRKIQFAAGLKLFQRNSTPPISSEHLSKIEYSYIEKCKAMVEMYQTLYCRCHNIKHPNIKGLLSHLRSLRTWFPIFTCYHCMTTFTDRKTAARHHFRCPKQRLETLIKLSNLKRRSEVKTRIYQNYKCTRCGYMYSFHEDFCTHVDEEHAVSELPVTCKCGRVFESAEDYKDHAYVSCLVEFYCDICFVTVKTLDEFQKHAAELHDNSEGFVLVQADDYQPRKRKIPEDYPEPKRMRYRSPPELIQNSDAKESKDLAPATVDKPTKCPTCFKEFTSHSNMLRHRKAHRNDPTGQSLYCCPDCGDMYTSAEWEKHKAQHGKKVCKECGEVYQFQTELDQHRSIHLNLKVYRDSKTSVYKSAMVSQGSICDICNVYFSDPEALKEHRLTHRKAQGWQNNGKSSGQRYFCRTCNKQYSGHSGISEHNRRKHPELVQNRQKQYPRKCDYCDKVCSTGAALASHKGIHRRMLENNQIKTERVSMVKPSSDGNSDESESYFNCPYCFKVFATRSNLKQHMRCHGAMLKLNPKGKYKKSWCDICHCPFETAEDLAKHKFEEHSSGDGMPHLTNELFDNENKSMSFCCSICLQPFNDILALNRHKLSHDASKKNNPYCKYCKVTFKNLDDFVIHMMNEHDDDEEDKKMLKEHSKCCTICGKNFTSMAALHSHQGWHKRGKIFNGDMIKKEPDVRYECPTCNESLPNSTALQIHILEKHRNVNTTLMPPRCSICNLDFVTMDDYEKHKVLHIKKEGSERRTKQFPCTYCRSAFSRADSLSTHLRQFHKDYIINGFTCKICNRKFERQNSLSMHMRIHERRDDKPKMSIEQKTVYKCSICNESFELPKELRMHTIQAHPF